ncbi:hypothetical protein [Amycolatopsis sp. MEPSY49]|uniref:hypothetical protein n=1 Tax=Amycolatopsis sp. MEPSY49 TaxID=3151600 RepID=UPI003EF82303
MPARLIDGVAARLAGGPEPAPGYRYPAPYDLTAKPCDALPGELFTALTADGTWSESFTQHEAFSVAGTNVKIGCTREPAAKETVTVTQTISATRTRRPPIPGSCARPSGLGGVAGSDR